MLKAMRREIAAIINAYPWDYVIGSVHFLGEWDISDFRQLAGWEGKDIYASLYPILRGSEESSPNRTV